VASAAPIPLFAARQSFYVPTFALYAQGKKVDRQAIHDVMSVTYVDNEKKVDTFTLNVNNWDPTTRRPRYWGFPKQDEVPKTAAIFAPGNELSLYMGYEDDRRLMMVGVVKDVRIDFPQSGASNITLDCQSVALDKMKQQRATDVWTEKTDSQVAKSLGERHLNIDVETDGKAAAAEKPIPYLLMYNEYPIAFLQKRAALRAYVVQLIEEASGGSVSRRLYFGPSEHVEKPVYELEWGKSLLQFSPKFNTSNQVKKVNVHCNDRKQDEPYVASATVSSAAPDINADHHPTIDDHGRVVDIVDHPTHTREEAERIAKDKVRRQVQKLLRATAVTIGLPDLRAGRKVVISGTDYRLDGTWHIEAATHTIDDSGYLTTLSLRREKKGRQ
jgi:Bacteriophage probable baseplate hub protein